MKNLSDIQLVVLAAKGDREALEALVKANLGFVYSVAYRYMGDSQLAEDASQEAFVKVWKNLSKFDAKKSFKAWLSEIVKNTCLDMLKKKREVSFSMFDLPNGNNLLHETIASDIEQPDEFADRSMWKNVVTLSLKKLSPAYQNVLQLYYDKGLNFREISQELNEPLHTVKSRHRRALMRLKEIIQ